MPKTYEQFFEELWGVVKNAGKDLLEEQHVEAKVRDLVEYAARAQVTIHTTGDPEVRRLAREEFEHRTAQIRGEALRILIEASKKERLSGLLEGVFGLVLKFGPALLA